MTDIVLLGVNHKTAGVELRECLAFSADETLEALTALQALDVVSESLVLSTCNRVEILMICQNADQGVAVAKTYLSAVKHIPVHQFDSALYIHRNADAIRHLFRVAASLDSMVLGEPQILGQLKAAYATASRQKTSGVVLNRLLHRAFFVAKRIRTATGIGDHAVSISYAAIELGRKIFGTLEGKTVLLIGAGEMAELAVEHLLRYRAGTIHVANRTFERGLELARRFHGQAVRFEEIPSLLEQVDIVISSTGAPGYVVTREMVRSCLRQRRNRSLFFIDIAVPRDIDPEINRLNNVYVYDIDDLTHVVEDNLEDRQREALKAERMIDEAVIQFEQWLSSLEVVPTIVALRQSIEGMVDLEIQRTLPHLKPLGEAELQALNKMKQALVNRILHQPTMFLKRNGYHTSPQVNLDITRKLFNLDAEPALKAGEGPDPDARCLASIAQSEH